SKRLLLRPSPSVAAGDAERSNAVRHTVSNAVRIRGAGRAPRVVFGTRVAQQSWSRRRAQLMTSEDVQLQGGARTGAERTHVREHPERSDNAADGHRSSYGRAVERSSWLARMPGCKAERERER